MNELINDNICELIEKEESTILSFDTLVLSGGSTKGIIILGALQYLYDQNYLNEINNFVGTSCGALIGFLLAIGYTPIEIIVYICTNQLVEKVPHFNIVAMINGHGASSFSNIYEELEKMTIAKIGYIPTFADIKLKNEKKICIVSVSTLQKIKRKFIALKIHLICHVLLLLECHLIYL